LLLLFSSASFSRCRLIFFLCVLLPFFLLMVMFLPHTISSISFLTTSTGSPLQSQFLMLSSLTNVSAMKVYTKPNTSRVSASSPLIYCGEIKSGNT
jgi:hypothetical protein